MKNLIALVSAASESVLQTLDAKVNPDAIRDHLRIAADGLEIALRSLGDAADAGGQLAHAGEIGADLTFQATDGQQEAHVKELHDAAAVLRRGIDAFETAAAATSHASRVALAVIASNKDGAITQAVEAATYAHDAVASITNNVAGKQLVPKWAGHKVPAAAAGKGVPPPLPGQAQAGAAVSDMDGKLRHPAVLNRPAPVAAQK